MTESGHSEAIKQAAMNLCKFHYDRITKSGPMSKNPEGNLKCTAESKQGNIELTFDTLDAPRFLNPKQSDDLFDSLAEAMQKQGILDKKNTSLVESYYSDIKRYTDMKNGGMFSVDDAYPVFGVVSHLGEIRLSEDDKRLIKYRPKMVFTVPDSSETVTAINKALTEAKQASANRSPD